MRMMRLLTAMLALASVFVSSGCILALAGKRLVDRQRRADDGTVYAQPDTDADSDPYVAIIHAYKSICDATSIRSKTIEVDSRGKRSETTFEFVAPNRQHVVHTFSDGSAAESIIIGQKTFKREKGKWSEVPLRYSAEREDMRTQCELQSGPPGLPGSVSRTTELVGRETLNGVQVTTYRTKLEFDSTDGGKDSMVYTASIGVKDGRLYQTVIDTSTNPSLNVHTTTTYSNYDDVSISIEPPV